MTEIGGEGQRSDTHTNPSVHENPKKTCKQVVAVLLSLPSFKHTDLNAHTLTKNQLAFVTENSLAFVTETYISRHILSHTRIVLLSLSTYT